MKKVKAWVYAARLRTLPLSVSGIIVGTALAKFKGYVDGEIFLLSLLTTVAFQITSNFANDYGDGTKGTDDEQRIGPKRALQSGLLSKASLKKGIAVAISISFILAVLLIYKAFAFQYWIYFFVFLLLGILCIWAAIYYTMGDSPYGYKGLGDVFVFLFFGLVSVLGSMFLYTKTIDPISILPAISIGLLCVAVLNLNNLRDVISDKIHGKYTLVVKMGFDKGKKYHTALIGTAILAISLFGALTYHSPQGLLYLLAFVPILLHLRRVRAVKQPAELDPELKKLAISTFLLALLFYISINYFL